jgi:hypothetical protein
MVDEVQTGLGRRGSGSPTSTRRGARRGDHGQGPRQRHAHRRLLGAGRRGVEASSPAITRPPTAGNPWPQPPPRAVLGGDGGETMLPEARTGRGAPHRALARRSGVAGSAWPRPPARRGAGRRPRRSGRWRPPLLDAGVVVNAVTPTALRWPRRCSSPTTRSTKRWCSGQGVRGRGGDRMTRHLLEIDDLTADRARRGPRPLHVAAEARSGCWPVVGRLWSSRSRRTAPATPPRWLWWPSAATRCT